MKPTDAVVTGAGATGLFSYFTCKLYGNMTDAAYNKYAEVFRPAGIVSIIIPAFNEERYIESTLRSVLSQNIIQKHPDYFECTVVDNESTDRTAEIAKQYCQVIFAPRGKLNARHAGIIHASGDIIVSYDADSYYPPNTLNLLLRHFHKPEVVAVNAPFLIQGNMLHRIGSVWSMNFAPFIKRRIHGSNSAFLRKAYFAVGGFDLSIDQFNRRKVLLEEEAIFYQSLRQLGKVVFDVQACAFTSGRSLGVKVAKELRLPTSEYYEEVARGERF